MEREPVERERLGREPVERERTGREPVEREWVEKRAPGRPPRAESLSRGTLAPRTESRTPRITNRAPSRARSNPTSSNKSCATSLEVVSDNMPDDLDVPTFLRHRTQKA